MGRIDDSLRTIETIEDGTERAFQLSGLISTLFKIRGVILVVVGQLAFDSYANSTSGNPELELATFSGKTNPRLIREIMAEQLGGLGLVNRWSLAGVPIHFLGDTSTPLRDLCRDFMTDHGVVKLFPAEELAAERILSAVYPVPNEQCEYEARLLLTNALSDAFQMDWAALQNICHQPEYRVGEELANLRAAAKRDLDEQGAGADQVGEVAPPAPEAEAAVEPVAEVKPPEATA